MIITRPKYYLCIDRTCGIGFQKRFRTCPSQDGCGPKESKQMQECHMHECPIIPKMSMLVEFNIPKKKSQFYIISHIKEPSLIIY